MKSQSSSNNREVSILKSFQSPRSKGTNSRKKGTNPRAKGGNKRVNQFLSNVLEIVAIKEQRNLSSDEVDLYTQATINFFVRQYQESRGA